MEKEQPRRTIGWIIGLLAGIGPALLHEGFVVDGTGWPLELIYAVSLVGGAIAGGLAVPDLRLWLFGGFTGLTAAAGATFAVSHFAHGMSSLGVRTAVMVAFVGGAPGLMIGGLFYGMAGRTRTQQHPQRPLSYESLSWMTPPSRPWSRRPPVRTRR